MSQVDITRWYLKAGSSNATLPSPVDLPSQWHLANLLNAAWNDANDLNGFELLTESIGTISEASKILLSILDNYQYPEAGLLGRWATNKLPAATIPQGTPCRLYLGAKGSVSDTAQATVQMGVLMFQFRPSTETVVRTVAANHAGCNSVGYYWKFGDLWRHNERWANRYEINGPAISDVVVQQDDVFILEVVSVGYQENPEQWTATLYYNGGENEDTGSVYGNFCNAGVASWFEIGYNFGEGGGAAPPKWRAY